MNMPENIIVEKPLNIDEFRNKSFTERLGVSDYPDKTELDKAFLELSKKYHPDVNKIDPPENLKEIMSLIVDAYFGIEISQEKKWENKEDFITDLAQKIRENPYMLSVGIRELRYNNSPLVEGLFENQKIKDAINYNLQKRVQEDGTLGFEVGLNDLVLDKEKDPETIENIIDKDELKKAILERIKSKTNNYFSFISEIDEWNETGRLTYAEFLGSQEGKNLLKKHFTQNEDYTMSNLVAIKHGLFPAEMKGKSLPEIIEFIEKA